MTTTDPNTLIFDIGNTLAPFNQREMDRIHGALADDLCVKLNLPRADFLALWTEARDADMAQSRATGEEHDFSDRLARVLNAMGKPQSPAFIESARQFLIKVFVESAAVDPGVADKIHKLAGRYKLGVLSNYLLTEPIHQLLERADLHHCFQKVLVSREIGFAKPDRRAFDAIVKALDADAGRAVYIGDDFEADVIGAIGYGMKALWTWAFRENIQTPTRQFSENFFVAKTRETYFDFLDDPAGYLNDAA